MGGAVGMQLALEHPGLVDRLVQFGGVSFSPDGNQPEPPGTPGRSLLSSLEGSRWHRAYLDVAPDPGRWPDLVEKLAHVDDDFGWTPDQVRSLTEQQKSRRCSGSSAAAAQGTSHPRRRTGWRSCRGPPTKACSTKSTGSTS